MKSIEVSDTIFALYIKYVDQVKVDNIVMDHDVPMFLLLVTMDAVTKCNRKTWLEFKKQFAKIFQELSAKTGVNDAITMEKEPTPFKVVKTNID